MRVDRLATTARSTRPTIHDRARTTRRPRAARALTTITLAAAALLAAAACGSGDATAPDESADATPRALDVARFPALEIARASALRVVDDSRCPMNALCIWEGSASVVLRFERAGAAAADTTLHTNARMGPTTFAYGGAQYTLFGLTPFPVAGAERPRAEEYVALVAVKR